MGPNAAPDLSLVSDLDFSITAPAYMQVNAFPAPLCDDSQCEYDTVCADPYFSDSCDCGLLYMGQNCSELLPYCSGMDASAGCVNQGLCMENWNRGLQYDDEGVATAYNLTWCDCTGTGIQSSNTGDYRGMWCDIPAPCDVIPCLNNGTCVNGEWTDYTCDCTGTISPNSTMEFIGDHCEISQTHACDVGPCEYGGTCTVDDSSPGGYSCACIDGWTGNTCTIAPTDACSNNPEHCKPYGVCVPGSNPDATVAFAECVCLWGYSGATCGTAPSACSELTCENGGVCVGLGVLPADPQSEAAGCLCVDPWIGQRCQWNYTNPPTFN